MSARDTFELGVGYEATSKSNLHESGADATSGMGAAVPFVLKSKCRYFTGSGATSPPSGSGVAAPSVMWGYRHF
jgi:hypothetical protein